MPIVSFSCYNLSCFLYCSSTSNSVFNLRELKNFFNCSDGASTLSHQFFPIVFLAYSLIKKKSRYSGQVSRSIVSHLAFFTYSSKVWLSSMHKACISSSFLISYDTSSLFSIYEWSEFPLIALKTHFSIKYILLSAFETPWKVKLSLFTRWD